MTFVLEDFDEIRECLVNANSCDEAVKTARRELPWESEHASSVYAGRRTDGLRSYESREASAAALLRERSIGTTTPRYE